MLKLGLFTNWFFIYFTLDWTYYEDAGRKPSKETYFTNLRPEGSRRAGRPKLRWLDGVEKDLRTLSIRGWRRRAQDRDRWKEALTAARAQNGL